MWQPRRQQSFDRKYIKYNCNNVYASNTHLSLYNYNSLKLSVRIKIFKANLIPILK